MISSVRAEAVSAERRGQLKMEIMGVMRRRLSGISAEHVSKDLKVDIMTAAQLLAEMSEEGLIYPQPEANTGLRYRLRSNL